MPEKTQNIYVAVLDKYCMWSCYLIAYGAKIEKFLDSVIHEPHLRLS